MSEAFSFELVSPEALVLGGEASEVVVPGTEGYFTVLANHSAFMTTVKPGIVDVKMSDGEAKRIFVRGGFADVSPTGFTLLAEQATMLEDFDILRAFTVLAVAWFSSHSHGPSIVTGVILFCMYAASALFSPVFQAQIPRLFDNENDYTAALALSRFVFDLEQILTPAFAALFLFFWPFAILFDVTSLCFIGSALLIACITLPKHLPAERPKGIFYNLSYGIRCYLATPRLQSVLVFSIISSLAGATVIVNSITLVGQYILLDHFGLTILLGCSGSGALMIALLFPKLTRRLSLRHLMTAGACICLIGIAVATITLQVISTSEASLAGILPSWFLIGIGTSLIQIPIGRLITQSSAKKDRTAYFSAQFGLSHLGWFGAYALSGWGGVMWGLPILFAITAFLMAVFFLLALLLWPSPDPSSIPHTHLSIHHNHPHDSTEIHHHPHALTHVSDPAQANSHAHTHTPLHHSHDYTIDAHHPRWPIMRHFFSRNSKKT